MKSTQNSGLKRILKACVYSAAGFKAAFCNEAAFRQEVMAAAILLPCSFLLGQSGVQKALLAGSILLVLIVELINSAVEATVDRLGDERHELAGRAKDMGSAAVFAAILNAVLIWTLIVIFPG